MANASSCLNAASCGYSGLFLMQGLFSSISGGKKLWKNISVKQVPLLCVHPASCAEPGLMEQGSPFEVTQDNFKGYVVYRFNLWTSWRIALRCLWRYLQRILVSKDCFIIDMQPCRSMFFSFVNQIALWSLKIRYERVTLIPTWWDQGILLPQNNTLKDLIFTFLL